MSDASTKKIAGNPEEFDWSRFDAMTDEEAEANALSDPDNPPMTPEQLSRMRRVAFVKHLRFKFMLTREEFAARYHIPLATLEDWEAHRSEPDEAARAYLKVIAKQPDMVAQALEENPTAAAAE